VNVYMTYAYIYIYTYMQYAYTCTWILECIEKKTGIYTSNMKFDKTFLGVFSIEGMLDACFGHHPLIKGDEIDSKMLLLDPFVTAF